MRATGRIAVAAVLATGLALLVAPGAHAAPPTFGPSITTLPSTVSMGGPGTPELSDAVAVTCNSGAPLAGAEWFSLANGDLGTVLVRAKREIVTGGHQPSDYTSTHVALVDLVTSSVLQCNGDPLAVTSARTVKVAVWVDAAEWQGWVESCTTNGEGCDQKTWVYADRSAPVPDNDTTVAARAIASLPFTDSGNTVRATADLTDAPSSCAVQSMLDPASYASVWWRWTAPVDGIVDAVPSGGGELACTGMYDVTGSDPVPVDHVRVDLNPTTRTPVVAGRTYLIGLFYTEDHYYRIDPLRVGGPYSLTVSWAARGPAAVSSLRTASDGSGGVIVSWQPPPPLADAPPVTGYHVSILAHGSSELPTTAAVDAATLTHTFTGLNPAGSYDIAVHGLNEAGAGTPRTRVFSLVDAGVYGDLAGPPPTVVARRSSRAATVAWTAPTYAGTTDVTGFRIRVFAVRTGKVVRSVSVADVRAARIGGLLNGVAYSFDVAAVNAVGPGTASRRSNAVVPATTPGAPVVGLSRSGARGGLVSALASWTAPRATGGARITGYVVTAWRLNRSGHLVIARVSPRLPATARHATLRLLRGSYRFSVRAVNAVGTGTTSARSNLVLAR